MIHDCTHCAKQDTCTIPQVLYNQLTRDWATPIDALIAWEYANRAITGSREHNSDMFYKVRDLIYQDINNPNMVSYPPPTITGG